MRLGKPLVLALVLAVLSTLASALEPKPISQQAGQVMRKQVTDLLVKAGPGRFCELAKPFVDPPYERKWLETPAETNAYFARNDYANFISEQFQNLDFTDFFGPSFKAPKPWYNKARLIQVGGGPVFWQGHIFPEGYFRGSFDRVIYSIEAISRITKHQPWFAWNGSTYGLREGGAVAVQMNTLADAKGNVTLYRGTYPKEFDLLRDTSKPLFKPDGAGKPQLPIYFFTPDRKAGFSWNKGIVEMVVIPASEWKKWTDDTGVYIGIEYTYHEIVFFKEPALSWLRRNVQKLDDKTMAELQRQKAAGTTPIDNPDR